ncbi:MAG TPA: hypothetical protein VK213_05955 [Bacteroidales bacterium]|nr:hypothetical protein [Bacteroidales bacterium]
MVTIEKRNHRFTFFDDIKERITKGERFMFYFDSGYWIKKGTWGTITIDEAKGLTAEMTLVCIWPKGKPQGISELSNDTKADYVYNGSVESFKSFLNTL